MAEILDESMLGDILKSGQTQYFFHKEEDGEVEVVFESSISITEPGNEDLVGRVWNPPIVDANGNQLLDFNGEPRQPWAKVEAKVIMNGAPQIYAFGGKTSSCLRTMIQQMNSQGIKNDDLPGTKWSINRTGKWNWVIQYLGKEELKKTPTPSPKNKVVDEIEKVIKEIVSKNPSLEDGVDKEQLVHTITFLSEIKEKQIEDNWNNLISNGIIKVIGDKVLIKRE